MSEDRTDSPALTAALAEAARPAGEHPEIEELFDYHAGRLDPETDRRLRAHLVACRSCTRRLLELEPFAGPAAAEDAAADFESEVSLRELEARIWADRGPASPFTPRRLAAAAAVLLLVAAGLGARLWWLEGELADLSRVAEELSSPRANFPLVYLEPTHRGFDVPIELPDEPVWVLVIVPEPAGEYGVDLLGAGGEELWSRRGLRPAADGSVTLWLPRAALPPGESRLRLYAFDGDRRTLERVYRLRSPE